jgi:Zn-dependent protease with chaperone function
VSREIPLKDEAGVPPPGWTAAERESFFDAISRHRRAAWRVTAISFLASACVALVVAVLLSPLFYALLALVCDIANLIVPTTNLVDVIGRRIGPAYDAPHRVSVEQWLVLACWAALPGLIFMAATYAVLRRAISLSGLLDGALFSTVPPDAMQIKEQRFGNVVTEMAIAAGVPAPKVLIAEWDADNAAVFGADDGSAVVVASRRLLARLDRAQLQSVVAHLVGSIANGDMAIGVRVAATVGLFGVIARFGAAFSQRAGMMRLIRTFAAAALRPSPATARAFVEEIADPFRPEPPAESVPGPTADPQRLDWRIFAWMPLAGPVFASGFFGGIIGIFGLEPLVALAWRRRKYLADATAVRLTREPDALAQALGSSGGGSSPLPLGAWGAHLCVVRPAVPRSGMLGGSVVPAFPAVDRRLRALVVLGASNAPAPAKIPVGKLALIIPLLIVAGGLMCIVLALLIYVSAALSAMFLGLPFGALHLLLRAIGHG